MKMNKRLIFSVITILVIGLGLAVAGFFAKGYRFSLKTGTISGTGIISVTTLPDQASVYLDGHLTTASNTNINNLIPKSYDVRITKDGFIPWEKNVEVKEGLVSEIKATLYRAIPTIYPLSFNGVTQVVMSPDESKLLYVVPQDPKAGLDTSSLAARKGGVWVWQVGNLGLPIVRGNDQRQVASSLLSGVDFTQATYRFSPDGSEILATLPDRSLLLESDRLNESPKDVTPTVTTLIKTWDEEDKTRSLQKLSTIKDKNLRQEASNSAVLKWSPDDTKLVYSKDGETNFKVVDFAKKKSFSLPDAFGYGWFPDSRHLYLVETEAKLPSPAPTSPVAQLDLAEKEATASLKSKMSSSKISVIEYDGFNKSEIFAGLIDPQLVVVWPDATRLLVVSSLPTVTASIPNLYGINLK